MQTKLPNFICVGASKTGTSSMHNILKQHSDIFLPEEKETHFFHKNYDKGIEWYKKHFQNRRNESATGEICPTYIYNENSPERLFNVLGKDIKLIFIFRNPADKLFSNYKMNIALFNEKKSLEDAVKNDLEKMKGNEEYPVAFHYIKKGFYDRQVERYLKFFSEKNMLFLIYETDMVKNAEETYKKIQSFLNVTIEDLYLNIKKIPGEQVKNKKLDNILNTSNPLNQFAKRIIPGKKMRLRIKQTISKLNKKKIQINKADLEKIRPFLIHEIYAESISKLEKLTGLDLSLWYTNT